MKLSTTRSRMITVAGIGIAAVVVIGGTATAASKITAAQIATGAATSRVVADGAIHQRDLAPSLNGLLHHGIQGAYYSVAKYDVGDTNGGAIATVACKNTTDVAISGGVQTLALGDNGLNGNVPVSSSFPGRMDWGTNSPKPGRLDGWIVQFGTETGAAPKFVNIYALCVPRAHIPVKTTYTESGN